MLLEQVSAKNGEESSPCVISSHATRLDSKVKIAFHWKGKY